VIAIGHILYTFTITYFGQVLEIFETAPKSLSVGVFSGGIMAAAGKFSDDPGLLFMPTLMHL
jgi:hypothetical protein